MKPSDILNAQILKEEASKKQRDPVVSPSNLGNCIRKLMIGEKSAKGPIEIDGKEWKPVKTPFTAQQLAVFRLGYKVEEMCYELFNNAGVLVAYQKEVSYRGIKGTLDFVYKDGDRVYLFDCKSVNDKKFGYLDKGEVDSGYAMQLTFYWLALKQDPEFKDVLSDNVCLFYVEKNNLLTKDIFFNALDWVGKVEQKLDDVFSARNVAIIPEEKEVRDWECFSVSEKFLTVKAWCPYLESGICPKKLAEYVAEKAMIEGLIKVKEEKSKKRKEKANV